MKTIVGKSDDAPVAVQIEFSDSAEYGRFCAALVREGYIELVKIWARTMIEAAKKTGRPLSPEVQELERVCK